VDDALRVVVGLGFFALTFGGGVYALRRSAISPTYRLAGWALILAGVAALLSQVMRIVFADYFR
jgi:hypothetical protein